MKTYVSLICLLLVTGASCFTAAKAQINVNDSLALVDLYNSTNGPGWHHNKNWLTKEPVKKWHGIKVTGTRVNNISLYNNRLNGILPFSIGNLTNVQYIDLSSNHLYSSIPSSIGNLISLTTLSLGYNQLNGHIPSSIGNLINLTGLYLGSNQLSGTIPSSIYKLVNIKSLFLNNNQLTGSISDAIGNMPELVQLILSYNQLSGSIPSSIGRLANLYSLFLSDNQLNGSIPESITNCAQLVFLNLSNNQLSGNIPDNIGNIPLLTLYLNGNHLSGSIPASLAHSVYLATLSLNNNQLTGTIPALEVKDYVDLSNNQLSGAIPAAITNVNGLQFLYLNNNQLSGSIPDSFSVNQNRSLHELSLSNNQLTGTIPSSLGNFPFLSKLYLDSNQLSGSIPATFRYLKQLQLLNLSHNQLSQRRNVDFPFANKHRVQGFVNNNLFTFNSLEFISQKFPNIIYAPQATIPVHQYNNTLSVSAGGTLVNNTYYWFKAGGADSTVIKGDSTFTPSASGKYYAKVTNVIATQLTLYTDTIDFAMNTIIANNRLADNVNKNKISLLVYPNPATSLLHIQTNGTADITITNGDGKVLLHKTINNNDEIQVSKYANGIYYIQNKTTGEVQKVVVIH